jgi:PhnB protein
MDLVPYLSFPGTANEALAFYTELIGGSVEFAQTFGETPAAEHMPEAWRGKLMHARARLGDTVVMASDSPPDRYARPQGTYLSLTFDNLDEARRVFAGLAEGGEVEMPFEPTFWAAGFGMLTDRYGTPWMVNCDSPA